jgi:hypothetical protein
MLGLATAFRPITLKEIRDYREWFKCGKWNRIRQLQNGLQRCKKLNSPPPGLVIFHLFTDRHRFMLIQGFHLLSGDSVVLSTPLVKVGLLHGPDFQLRLKAFETDILRYISGTVFYLNNQCRRTVCLNSKHMFMPIIRWPQTDLCHSTNNASGRNQSTSRDDRNKKGRDLDKDPEK